MQMWFASTRVSTCTTKTSGGEHGICTKVGLRAQRQCAKVSWGPSHKCSAQMFNRSHKGCAQSLNPPHAIFVRSTKSFCAQRLCFTQSCCAHKARSARSLHTDNANGSGIVVLNIIIAVRGMLQTHGHTDRPMDMGHSEGEDIQNERTVCNMQYMHACNMCVCICMHMNQCIRR